MKIRPSMIEAAAVTAFFLVGMVLRTQHLAKEAVEHFDEGIYSSVLWHDGAFQAPYPARDFYAPPLVPWLIDIASFVPLLGRFAPFLPSVLLGSLTVLAIWSLARAWFGVAAGLFAAAVVAMSDFHILYSRMAMTDVPCLFWIIAAVYFGTLAIQKKSLTTAIGSGFICGLAWWTKYTGWLPLAIVLSGVSLWWIWVGRKSIGALTTLKLLAVMVFTALTTFAPWWWHLQSVGGYAAVSANHAGYMSGWSAWGNHMAAQLSYQFWLDGATGAFSLGLGLIVAGVYRWLAAECFTWNTVAARWGVSGALAAAGNWFVSVSLLFRFIAAGAALALISLRIWTPLMLSCLALAGFGGIFLWPVLQRLWLRANTRDQSPTSEGSLPLTRSDLESAAIVDPALGLCTTLTWFLGMLVVTPLYHPYSRLFFPLLASIWIAAAGAVGWWLESNISVGRRIVGTGETPPRRTWGQYLVSSMLVAAVFTSFLQFNGDGELEWVRAADLMRATFQQDRTSIRNAAIELADICVWSARGISPAAVPPIVPTGENFSPEAVLKAEPAEDSRPVLKEAERRSQQMVVYVFGEPALCLHLSQAGLAVGPVSHLKLGEADGSSPAVPTFLIIGPHAKRTPGFWEEWMQKANGFESLGEVQYFPSELTLLDLFSTKWLQQHNEAATQTFEVYRVK